MPDITPPSPAHVPTYKVEHAETLEDMTTRLNTKRNRRSLRIDKSDAKGKFYA